MSARERRKANFQAIFGKSKPVSKRIGSIWEKLAANISTSSLSTNNQHQS